MAEEVLEDSCIRCQVLLEEIRIKNEIIDDLQEKIDQMEWAMGI
jgi:hypothetical protein